MMTALRARMFERRCPCGRPRCRARGPASGASRWIAVILCSSRISTPAFLRRGLERPHQAVAGGAGLPHRRIGRLAGLHQSASPSTAQCISRGTELPTELPPTRVRRLVDEDDAVRHQPLEGGGAVVGEGADDLAVVVAVIRKAVRLDHRPVGQVAEQQVGRIRDAVFLLHAGAAAQRHVAAAGDGVAADIGFGLDQDDRAPASRATMAAGRPVAPEPMTTTSASRSQLCGTSPFCASITPPPKSFDVTPDHAHRRPRNLYPSLTELPQTGGCENAGKACGGSGE